MSVANYNSTNSRLDTDHTYGSITNNTIGEVTLVSTHQRVSFIRKFISDGGVGVEVERGDNIDKEVMLGRDGIKEILNADSVEDLSLVHIDGVLDKNYSCYICGEEHGEVHRMKRSEEHTFAISFHFSCLEEFAQTGKELLEEHKVDLLSHRV